ncbi:SprT-like domain-containing protein [Microdochium nivale]|nr:SprT-like domain-containing protein [Microdochium nivale]
MSRSSSGLSTPGELAYDHAFSDQPFFEGGKRRISITGRYGPDDGPYDYLPTKSKRARHAVSADLVIESIPPFYVIREDSSSPAPLPPSARERHRNSWQGYDDKPQERLHDAGRPDFKHTPAKPAMTTAGSKGSISSTTNSASHGPDQDHNMSDEEAATVVELHVAENHKRNRHSKHERILKSLINPKARSADFEIDDEAIQGIFYAANEFFFCGRLKGRVTWEWAERSNSRFQANIIGTTALRKASEIGGYETLIILSSHFLRDRNYSRRLLISTFLHELVHSYLFICCGFKARASGGHTDGFVRIASLIDDWAGPDTLHLKNIEADLDDFLADSATYQHDRPLRTSYCSGHTCERPPSRDSVGSGRAHSDIAFI